MVGCLEGSHVPVELVADALEPVSVQLALVHLRQMVEVVEVLLLVGDWCRVSPICSVTLRQMGWIDRSTRSPQLQICGAHQLSFARLNILLHQSLLYVLYTRYVTNNTVLQFTTIRYWDR